MRILIALFLSFLILTNNQIHDDGSYRAYPFINYLKEIGYYDLLYFVKCTFGVNVAINLCEELTSNVECEYILKVYIPECKESQLDFCSLGGKEKFDNILSENLKDVPFKIDLDKISKKMNYKLCSDGKIIP